MRMRLLACALPLLMTAPGIGCRATPGFTWAFSITQPPVLSSPAPMTPIQAPATAYAVEQPQPFVTYVRQPILSPRMAPMSEACPLGCAPGPVPVPAAMPQQRQAEPCPPTTLPAPMPRGPAKSPAGDCE